MQRVHIALCFVVVVSLGFALPNSVLAQRPLDGDWLVSIQVLDHTDHQRWTLTQMADGRISGTFVGTLGPGTLNGTIDPSGVFTVDMQNNPEAPARSFTGRRTGEELRGDVPWRLKLVGRWIATRIPVSLGPRVHDFAPTTFRSAIGGQDEPALRIFAGDSVRTSTIDADGVDAKGVRRAIAGGYTGPFYVEGAMPGDALVVRLTRLKLNRDTGFSFQVFHPATVVPDYLAEAARDPAALVTFKLDREAGIARPVEPSSRTAGLALPVVPMLGTIAVAPPPGISVDGNTLGRWGGNLDYAVITEGATVYFPVLRPGALLYIGDAHATQGDGEVSGAGVETSMDVEFTVDLIPGAAPPMPRIERKDELISVGIAGDLEQAMRTAITELARWLTSAYGFSQADNATLLGQAVRLDVANVVGRQRVVGARIHKDFLPKPVGR